MMDGQPPTKLALAPASRVSTVADRQPVGVPENAWWLVLPHPSTTDRAL
jgi:hypothetical protein